MKLLPIENYENSPEFSSLPQDQKDTFYANYSNILADQGSKEANPDLITESTRIRYEKALDYFKTDFNSFVKSNNFSPDEVKDFLDNREKFRGTPFDPYISQMYDLEGLYSNYQYNVQSKPKSIKTSTGREFKFRPYMSKGTAGIYVEYPDGKKESFEGADSISDILIKLRDERGDRFQGDEFNEVYDEIRGTTGFWPGLLGGIKSKITSQLMEYDLQNYEKALRRYNDILNNKPLEEVFSDFNILPLPPALTRKFPSMDSGPILRNLEDIMAEELSDFIDRRKEVDATKRSRSADQRALFIETQQNGNDSLKGNVTYFVKNPSHIIPWMADIAINSIPEMAQSVAVAAAGSIAGGPIGAGSAGAGWEAYREYTATYLSELEATAAREKKSLYSVSDLDSILSDPEFKQRVEEKAKARAGSVAGFGAVAGILYDRLGKSITGPFRRALARTGVEAVTEGQGEALAQAVTENQLNFSEILAETIGGTGSIATNIPVAYAESTYEKQQQAKEAIEQKKEAFKKIILNESQKLQQPTSGIPATDQGTDQADQETGETIEPRTDPKSSQQPSDSPAVDGQRTEEPIQEERELVEGDKLKPEVSAKSEETELKPKPEPTEDQADSVESQQAESQQDEPTQTESQPAGPDPRRLNLQPISSFLQRTRQTFANLFRTIRDNTRIQNLQLPEGSQRPSIGRTDPVPIPENLTVEEEQVIQDPAPQEGQPIDEGGLAEYIVRALRIPQSEVKNLDPSVVQTLRNPLVQEVLKRITSNEETFDRMMTTIRNNARDLSDWSGRMIRHIGLTPTQINDATNVFVNMLSEADPYYSEGQGTKANTILDTIKDTFLEFGFKLADDRNAITRQNVNQGDIAILLGSSPTSEEEHALERKNVGVIDRLKKFGANIAFGRNFSFQKDVDKLLNAKALGQPSVGVMDLGNNFDEAFNKAKERFKDTGFVIKPRKGYQSKGVIIVPKKDIDRLNLEDVKNKITRQRDVEGKSIDLNDMYFEPLKVQRGGGDSFYEWRVHALINNKGDVMVFRNATFDKSDGIFSTVGETIPISPNDPFVSEIHREIEKLKVPDLANTLVGFDVGIATDGVHIFEANPLTATTYGGSGWFLSAPLTQIEAYSELLGVPSMWAMLYNVAKSKLPANKVKEILSRINNLTYVDGVDPTFRDIVISGYDLFNPYVDAENWMELMRRSYPYVDISTLKKIYSAIDNVVNKTVAQDVARHFNASYPYIEEYEGLGLSKKLRALRRRGLPQSVKNLIKAAINDGSYLTEDQKLILKYILDNANGKFLNRVQIKRISDDKLPNYDPNTKTLYLREDEPADVFVHEVVHTVTVDYLSRNDGVIADILQSQDGKVTDKKYIEFLFSLRDEPFRQRALEAGLQQDYIDLALQYTSFIESNGLTLEDIINPDSPIHLGSQEIDENGVSESYKFWENNKHLDYAVIDMSEFAAEVLSNEVIKQKLESIKPKLNMFQNVWQAAMNAIRKILGIPIWKSSLLERATKTVKDIIGNPSNSYFYNTGGYAIRFGNSFQEEAPEISNIKLKDKYVDVKYLSNQTAKNLSDVARAEAGTGPTINIKEIEDIKISAKREAEENIITSLKERFPNVLSDYKYNGRNLDDAFNLISDYLEPILDSPPETKVTAEMLNDLLEEIGSNALGAGQMFKQIMDQGLVTENNIGHFFNGFDRLMDEVAALKMSVKDLNPKKKNKNIYNRLLNVNNILMSLKYGTVPKAFGKYVTKAFVETNLNKLDFVVRNDRIGFGGPIPDWRRRPFSFLSREGLGELSMMSTEIKSLGPGRLSFRYLNYLFSQFRGQIDPQRIEEQANIAEFEEEIKKQFPKGMSLIQSRRIGWVATLAQYLPPDDPSTRDETARSMLNFISLADSGIKTQAAQPGQSEMAAINRATFNAVTRNLNKDPGFYTDPDQVVSDLESTLTKQEKAVLFKIREIGSRYVIPMSFVGAMHNKGFTPWTNYVLRRNRTRFGESPGVVGIYAFDSMDSPLHQRENIDPEKSWYDPDINSIATDMFSSITYEKYTGVNRVLIKNLLNDQGFRQMIEKNSLNPVRTDRIKTLMGNFHAAYRQGDPYLSSFAQLAAGIVTASVVNKIISPTSAFKNIMSSLFSRFTILGNRAANYMFEYEKNKGVMDDFFKKYVPTQYQRVGQFDNMLDVPRRGTSYSYRLNREIGNGIAKSIAMSVKWLPTDLVRLLNNKVFGSLAKLFSGMPEAFTAKGIWTAVYLNNLIERKRISTPDSFFRAPFYDAEAAQVANNFADSSLGYSPFREDKGTFWNGDSTGKQILSRTLFTLRQQQTGLSLEFQQNVVNGVAALKGLDPLLAQDYFTRAAFNLSSIIVFRLVSMRLAGLLIGAGMLKGFISGEDDEEKRNRIEKASRQLEAVVHRAQLADSFMEIANTFLPGFTTFPQLIELTGSLALDSSETTIESNFIEDWANKGINLEMTTKKELGEIQERLEKEIEVLEEKDYLNILHGKDPVHDQQISVYKQYLDYVKERKKFKYLPQNPNDALSHMLGGIGFVIDGTVSAFEAILGDDTTTEERQRLKELIDEQQNQVDILSWNRLALWAGSTVLRFGQNPSSILRKAQLEAAKEALKKENEIKRDFEYFRSKHAIE